VGILSRERPVAAGGVAWPLAARVGAGLASLGSERLVTQALEGAGLDAGSRVVQFDTGLGEVAAMPLAGTARSWTALDPDPIAVAHLSRLMGAPGRRAICADAADTGLDEGAFTIALLQGSLTTRSDREAAAVIAEARRLLAPAGSLVVIDLVLTDGRGVAADALRAAGLRPRTSSDLRALVAGADLALVGDFDGAAGRPSGSVMARRLGPRGVLRLARAAGDPAVRRAATTVRQALDRAAPALRAGAVVAERPLVMGLRRPRT
jgi:SAM-dependent methyltransferase